MNKHYKIFIVIVVLIISMFSIKVYIENENTQKIKDISVEYEAKSIADFLLAFRETYQDIFIGNHTRLDESNIDFLPVRTTNEIARRFSILNMQAKLQAVSDNPRNIVNKANPRQIEIIKYFRKNKNSKDIFKIIDNTYYYSQPLYITNACLKCHGKREDAPLIIQNNYNTAYNYKLGELRGIIDIELHQTKLTQLLEANHKMRILTVFIFVSLLLFILFVYTRYNYKLEHKVKEEIDKNKSKDKELIQQATEQKEYLNTVIESNNSAVITIDKSKKILTYNVKAQDIFGFTQEEMLGSRNLLNIIPLKYKNLHTVASELYFKTGKSKGIINKTLELEGLTKDERTIPIRISFGSNQNSSLVVATIADISHEKEQENILKQQSKLAQMGEMISMIAHQWRQPLSAISSLSTGMNLKARLGNLNNEMILELSNNITQHSKHLSETIDDFREFFKPNKEKSEADFNSIVQGVLNIIEVSITTQNIKIIKELECHCRFNTYPNEIKQVVLNLIKNAEDALIENKIKNPYIKIRSYIQDTYATLEISDNAGGISEDIIENIFDPYYIHVSNSDEGAVFTIELNTLRLEESSV